MEKQWLWANSSGGTSAAIADFEDGTILWLDEPGCACSTHNNVQKFTDFLTKGARYLSPPEDVLAEIREALQVAVLSD
jgi:hypothetical protein